MPSSSTSTPVSPGTTTPPPVREPQRGLRGRRVPGTETVEVDGVRDDGRPDAEDVADVVIDRNRLVRIAADRGAHELRASVGASLGQRRAQVPHNGKASSLRK